ncbi:copper-binding protein [Noviherbaspirillum cavernae]|uniref:Copper-binding protein n=1 Tax=Noviherbaspirillum cavernae TaxID=2320862 RepID=A0A418WWJ6_9BURK|nr:copper-binding protein [Noviherbaspirillum cavernae]
MVPARNRLRYLAVATCVVTALLSVDRDTHADPPRTRTVVIEALRYTPQTLEVNSGDTVIWRNKDPFPHTVTSEGRGFDSGEIADGKSWKFKASQKGSFPYVCTLHPTMKGSLIVK